jgi:hypothetical protein
MPPVSNERAQRQHTEKKAIFSPHHCHEMATYHILAKGGAVRDELQALLYVPKNMVRGTHLAIESCNPRSKANARNYEVVTGYADCLWNRIWNLA